MTTSKPAEGGRFIRKSRDEKPRRAEDATAPQPPRAEREAAAAPKPETPADTPAQKKGK